MRDSLFGLVGDLATIVMKPVEAAVDVTRLVTKPLAEGVEAVADEIKELTKEIEGDKL